MFKRGAHMEKIVLASNSEHKIEEIKDIYKDVKPFTKIDRCRNDLIMMQLYGTVAHGLLSLLWIIFLVV